MIWLFELGLVAVLIVGAVSYFTRGRRTTEYEALLNRRVEAYMQTIRREGANPALTAMSDGELRDLLFSAAHNLRADRARKGYVLAGACAVAVFAAIVVGSEEGARGFGIAVLVAALAVYGLNEYLGRRLRQPLTALGIDAERLRVE